MEYEEIKLKNVTQDDFKFLYDLLAERNPKANISHKKMPTFEEHIQFILSKPYKEWNVLMIRNVKVGSVYLSRQNEIGIFIKKEFQNKGFGKIALDLIIKKNGNIRYLANVNPNNTDSINFFTNYGFKIIQNTYEFDKNEK